MKGIKLLTVLAISTLISVASNAATYYAAVNGYSGYTGLTASAPWPLAYALSRVASGDTIVVLPGTYSGDWEINKANVTLRSQTKWAARLVNMPYGVVIGYGGAAPGIVLDGFEIAYSAMHNVLIYSANSTIRNCWIHDASIGSRPNSSADAGSGIHSAGVVNGTTVEYCLIENNGSSPGYDHGIYIAGDGLTVRGNVFRGNWGFGICLYDTNGGMSQGSVYDNLVYGNATFTASQGGSPLFDGVYLVPRNGYSIWFYNNTVIASKGPPIQGAYGTVYLTNNIIIGPSSSMTFWYGGTLAGDYNLCNYRVGYTGGAHDVISGASNFVNPANGLYWLTASSPARGAANRSVVPPLNFFGGAQSSVADVGAFQYSASLATDTRDLDPSTANGADYWAGNTTTNQPGKLLPPKLRIVTK